MGFGTAYEDGELRHVSASQIATFEQCPAKWYNNIILKRPSFQDYRLSQLGVAIHVVLERNINTSIGKAWKSGKVMEASLLEEANNFVANEFNWKHYFIGHQISGAEVEMSYPIAVGNTFVDLVGSIDVESSRRISGAIIPVSTDWKVGYASDKGVDIQAQCNGLLTMLNYGTSLAFFRRIYPRLPGDEPNTKKVEEYIFNREDIERYKKGIAFSISKMLKVISGEMPPVCNPSDACASCGFAHSCIAAKSEAFTTAQLVGKLKVIEAAKRQVEDALKKVADKGNFFVGDEEWGYQISDNYRLPYGIKKNQIPKLLALHNPQMLRDKATVQIDSDVKKVLEGYGVKNIKNHARKTLKILNEEELKARNKETRRSETTLAGLAKSA